MGLAQAQTFQEVTPEEHRQHRHEVDELLWLFDQPGVPQAALRFALSETFSVVRFPLSYLATEQWVALFRRASFPAYPSAEPVRLYRGAAEGWERGMSWTPSVLGAREFGFPLWTCLAPASSILALLKHNDQSFVEYVLDLPDDVPVLETNTPVGGGVVLRIPGSTSVAVAVETRAFLAHAGLDDLRPSALGWMVKQHRKRHAHVRFFGPDEVVGAVAQSYGPWMSRRSVR